MGSSQQATAGGHSAQAKDGIPHPPPVALCALHPEDPLLAAWQLSATLPPATPELWQQHDAMVSTAAEVPDGQLRLSARHDSGELWEHSVPFTELARAGGMVVGQCPHASDIVLPHESVSDRHALLEIAETGLVITALCPQNNTCVNEQALSPYDRRFPLFHGSKLLLGDAQLQLEYIH